MNLKSTICCTLLFLTLVDATSRHLRGHGPALSWSVITFPQDLDFGIKTIPESFAPGEPNPGKPSCAIGNRGVVACQPIFAPVLCGDDCQYENLCSAQAGPGFTKEDCKPVAKENPVDWSVDAQCAKPILTADGCPEIFSPVSCDDCIYDNICFAEAAGFLRGDCEPAKVNNMPVPGDIVPGNPTVVDTVLVHNIPRPQDTLPGNPPVVDMVVVNNMPVPCIPPVVDMVVVPEDTLLVNTNGSIEEPATEPIEEPTTGMGPSTIAIGEPNPATPILIGDLTIPGELPDNVVSDPKEFTSAYPDTPATIIPGRLSASILSDPKGGTWAYSDTPGRIIPGSPPNSVVSTNEESSSGTYNASSCRKTSSDVICDEAVDPVLCGTGMENCLYGNLCLGIGAGFSETDCRSDR